MRQIVGTLLALVTFAAAATGCASSSKDARSQGDVVAQMNNELSHTVPGSEVGTTTLTSAPVETSTEAAAPLPEERGSTKTLQTEPVMEAPAAPPVPRASGN